MHSIRYLITVACEQEMIHSNGKTYGKFYGRDGIWAELQKMGKISASEKDGEDNKGFLVEGTA